MLRRGGKRPEGWSCGRHARGCRGGQRV